MINKIELENEGIFDDLTDFQIEFLSAKFDEFNAISKTGNHKEIEELLANVLIVIMTALASKDIYFELESIISLVSETLITNKNFAADPEKLIKHIVAVMTSNLKD